MDEREKLRHLLEHWIEHNEEHSKEFQEWAAKAKAFGETAVSDDISAAVQHLKDANVSLGKASDKLATSN